MTARQAVFIVQKFEYFALSCYYSHFLHCVCIIVKVMLHYYLCDNLKFMLSLNNFDCVTNNVLKLRFMY